MKLLVPLYVYPACDGQLAREWRQMKDAQYAGIPIVAIANPGSGPGTDGDRPSYEMGMQALCDSGVEVIGYVASGYGKRSENQVKEDIDRYKEWYGRWMSGIFLDETAHVADEISDGDGLMCARYRGYLRHVQKHMGEAATVVMNTGIMLTEPAMTDGVGGGVIWNVLENSRESMEKEFGRVQVRKASPGGGGRGGGGKTAEKSPSGRKLYKLFSLGSVFGRRKGRRGGGGGRGGEKVWKTVVGTPPGAPLHVKGRAAFMVHGATSLSDEELRHWVNQLQDGGWSHAYLTDKVFDPTSCNTALHNPWNATPTYWSNLVKAVGELRESTRS
eukprot:g10547.t1